ncbi:hypothetical protein APA_3146 [Pseudanabaena sp. lw0831]|uniref:hypothetical protein n=1 Tax=Pseudanabaena sp. lw0831 TaxID=1357935 RepID=UPI0019158DD0|nr:hypothetical protein [Pseudanabaena sp. lw0831]GBO55096.1 hypothetical protein APA_3146 [Pseudanabaena sp. lw0831]
MIIHHQKDFRIIYIAAVISALVSTWVLVFFLVPETKGLTLEEIEIRWAKAR